MARISFTAPERGALLAKAVKATVGPMRDEVPASEGATPRKAGDAMTLLDLADALIDGRGRDFDALLTTFWRDVALAGLGDGEAPGQPELTPEGAPEPSAGDA